MVNLSGNEQFARKLQSSKPQSTEKIIIEHVKEDHHEESEDDEEQESE